MAGRRNYYEDERERFTRSGVLCLVLGVLMSVGFLYNMLWREHPSLVAKSASVDVIEIDSNRKTATRNLPATQTRVEVAGSELPEPPAAKADPMVAAIERELIAAGFLEAPARGLPGQRVRTAIAQWQRSKGIAVTGAAHQDLLEQLIYERRIREALNFPPLAEETEATAPATVAPPETNPEGDENLRMVQRGLAALGYRPGPVTGTLTAETQAAIKLFEKDRSLAVTGKLSKPLLKEMREFGSDTAQAPQP